ncbi:hypothetical protein BH20ACT2_BH20ACT2_09890 [soil metagenome]
MDFGQQREINKGFGDTLARAFELALTPAIFAFLGHLLDRRLGTGPLFLLVFFAFVVVYEMWRMFVRYDTAMGEEEAKLFGPRRSEP